MSAAKAGTLTRHQIVDVALRLLDDGGLPALAMRRIATELGVQQSALYWHVDSKQELLAAVADEILAEVTGPDADSWQERITDTALALRAELLRHRDGAELVAAAFAFRLGASAPWKLLTTEFAAAGLTTEDAETAASVLLHFVLGYTTNEQQHAQAARAGAIESEAQGGHEGARQFSTDRFVRGIAVIVAGVAARISIGA